MNVREAREVARTLAGKYRLDLSGLVILTEGASGSYLFNPLLSIIAGAKRTIAYIKSSRFGAATDVQELIERTYQDGGSNGKLELVQELTPGMIEKADIVTNSGHLRPIDREFIQRMKNSAVIPLMWEPWEMRSEELDLGAARECGVLVMGTNEHEPPCDMSMYTFLTGLRLLMEHERASIDENILILGGQATLAGAIEAGFKRVGLNSRTARVQDVSDVSCLEAELKWATYLLIAEHEDSRTIVGSDGVISAEELTRCGVNAVGVIAGCVRIDELEARSISVQPRILAQRGYMSYQPSVLGPYPVMDLFAAGLKVGQEMARARLSGLTLEESENRALQRAPAMKCEGEALWN